MNKGLRRTYGAGKARPHNGKRPSERKLQYISSGLSVSIRSLFYIPDEWSIGETEYVSVILNLSRGDGPEKESPGPASFEAARGTFRRTREEKKRKTSNIK